MIPMNTLKKTTLAVCATFALSSTAFAASHGDKKKESLSAHEHGVSKMNIVQD